MPEVKIAIAEDQEMFRAGLAKVINSKKGLKVTIEAANGKDLINQARGNVPDIVFMDFQMPIMNGIEATRILTSKYPDIKILMLSNYEAEEFVLNSIANGAVGYITKEESAEEIFKAIESTCSTGYYLNDRTSKHLIGNLVSQGKIKPRFEDEEEQLNEAEIEVIKLMSRELTTKEIADMLHKSARTIDGYKASIMTKTGVKNACGVIMYGVKNGIIKIDKEY
ncbi:MAG: response regulator transcription factor [Crocinitomicaceae bacterium]|nr:response regulator transcription factor [Crocinitomicaceae bacterium]